MGSEMCIRDRGNHKDPVWSNAEFEKACMYILHAYEMHDNRVKNADCLSAKAKKDMLKRESQAYDNICITLHLIRIGKAGAKRFRENLENEAARDHFERFFEGNRSFKHFLKELEKVQAKASSQPQQTRSSSTRRGRGRRHQRRRTQPRSQRYRRQSRLSLIHI